MAGPRSKKQKSDVLRTPKQGKKVRKPTGRSFEVTVGPAGASNFSMIREQPRRAAKGEKSKSRRSR